MFAKVGTAAIGALILIPLLIATSIHGAISAVFGGGSSQPSTTALADIPADYLTLYLHAAHTCPGLDWTILAAIGKIESDHGRSTLPGVAPGTENSAGARGTMQFLQPTFDAVVARHPIPSGGATPPSPWDKHDAIYAAAWLLCDSNASNDLRAAIFAYNHLDTYVSSVLAMAENYRSAPIGGPPAGSAAVMAIRYAQQQIGQPYVWGGNGPNDSGGFDCSGLTTAAYAAAGVTLPRTAQTQYDATPRVVERQLLPGDLVFYGTPSNIHHVGLYVDAGRMIDAATFGTPVGYHPIRYPGDDFAGGGRVTKIELLPPNIANMPGT